MATRKISFLFAGAAMLATGSALLIAAHFSEDKPQIETRSATIQHFSDGTWTTLSTPSSLADNLGYTKDLQPVYTDADITYTSRGNHAYNITIQTAAQKALREIVQEQDSTKDLVDLIKKPETRQKIAARTDELLKEEGYAGVRILAVPRVVVAHTPN